MKDQATKILIIISFLIVFISLENVNAASVGSQNSRQNICGVEKIEVGATGFVYNIARVGANVKPNLIVKKDISDSLNKNCFCNNFDGECATIGKNGFLCNPENTFDSVVTQDSCAISQVNADGTYEYTLCQDQNYSDAAYELKKTMTQTMNNDGTYTITMEMPSDYKQYANNIYIEYCNQNNCKIDTSEDGTALPTHVDQIIKANNDGTYSIKLPAGTDYYFVFKGNIGGICNSSFLGYYQGLTPTTVKNTLYNHEICTNMRKMFPKKSDSWMTGLLSDCYSDTISKSRLTQFSSEINAKWELLQSILNNTTTGESTSTSQNSFTCEFDETKNKHSEAIATYTSVLTKGTYWSAMCTEELYLEYDHPKAVSAGSSFDYNATITVKRTCQPIQVSKPVYKDTCEYGVECWGGPANHTGQAGAGPNNAFDSCISTCDNGKYTQKCINSCYQQVYKNKTTSNSSIKFQNTLTLNNYQAKFISLIGSTKANGGNSHTLNPVSSECVVAGNIHSKWWNSPDIKKCGIQCDETTCTTEHGIKFSYLDSCNKNENAEATMCYEVYKSSDNCSTNALGEYQQALEASHDEYLDILTLIQEVNEENLKNEKYTMSILERYNDNDTLTTIFDNKSGNNKIYSKEEDQSSRNLNSGSMEKIADKLVDGLTNEQKDWIQNGLSTDSYTLTRTISLKIGAAYVTRDGSSANDSGTLSSSQTVTYNRTNDLTDTKKDNDSLYYGPYNKYFTSLYTQLGINDYKSWPYYNEEVSINKSTDEYEKNIKISLENIGTWNQWGKTIDTSESNSINIQCFYGTTPKDCGWICPPEEDDSGGIQYIFRPINLGDIFPNNRNPRFNWTGTVKNNTATGAAISKTSNQSKYQNYEDVNPEGLIKAIENKNESIYNVTTDASEIDYEFVLTKENIRNIRNYNKNIRDYNHDGDNNYLDYNMSCYTNNRGQEICTSKFMDNINGNAGDDSYGNFITYSVSGYGIDERKSIAGCNNAIHGNTCDTSLFGSY